ncbi:MAG: alpha-L-arabinofuranosidase C-terminal domain-containing protein, partial [Ignavibacteria bacterium]|nr:alpha-L-arabinofuranosidase C-terminal domain-containing protein [Ignavibacteria bacterium]
LYSSKDFDDVPLVDATAVLGDEGELTVFAVNRSLDNDIQLTCDLRAFQNMKFEEHIVLHHDDVKAINTEAKPNTVIPVIGKGCESDNELFNLQVPALSWNVFKFSVNRN